MADPNTLGMEGSAYFRNFLDNNKRSRERRATMYGAKKSDRKVSPRSIADTHVKVAEAIFDFETRKTLFKPKKMVVAELYKDGFVEVYRTHEKTGKETELYIDRISLLLTEIKELPSKKYRNSSLLFILPDGKTYTFSHRNDDKQALEFLRVAQKLAYSIKIKHQNNLLSADNRRSDSFVPDEHHPVRLLSGGKSSPSRVQSHGSDAGVAAVDESSPLSRLRTLLQQEEAVYTRRRISKSGDYSRFGWRGVPAEEFLKLTMSPVKIRRCLLNMRCNFNERFSIQYVMHKSLTQAIQLVAPQTDEFFQNAMYTAQHKFKLDPLQFPLQLSLVVDTPVQDVLFESNSAGQLRKEIPEIDLVIPLVDLFDGTCKFQDPPEWKRTGKKTMNLAV